MEDEAEGVAADEGSLVLVEGFDGNVFEEVGSGGGAVEAAEDVHEGGFSRAVVPEHCREAAFFYIKI